MRSQEILEGKIIVRRATICIVLAVPGIHTELLP